MLNVAVHNYRMMHRYRLLIVTKVIGFIGLILLTIPFIVSLNPSEAAIENTRVMVDLETVPVDGYKIVYWMRLPVVIFRPGKLTIDRLRALNSRTPNTAIPDRETPEVFAYIAVSTYLGCSVREITQEDERLPESWWVGGWIDPCHMGAWDYAGRTLRNVSVPEGVELSRLQIVPFEIIRSGTISYISIVASY